MHAIIIPSSAMSGTIKIGTTVLFIIAVFMQLLTSFGMFFSPAVFIFVLCRKQRSRGYEQNQHYDSLELSCP